jgi:hypothetical protein
MLTFSGFAPLTLPQIETAKLSACIVWSGERFGDLA